MTLRELMRDVIHKVNVGDEAVAKQQAELVRAMLAEHGLSAGCMLGFEMDAGDDTCVVWYAGQFLSIVDKGSWFAMNTLIKFCPARQICL